MSEMELETAPVDTRYMDEGEQALAAEIYEAIQQASIFSERGMQSKEFRLGVSDLGYCSERARRMLARQEPDDTDMLKAAIGTALGEMMEHAIDVSESFPGAILQSAVEITLVGETQTYTLPGHPDIVLPDRGIVLDGKSAFGLALAQRTGMEDQQKRFQRHCLLPNTPILMGNLTWKRLSDLRVGDVVKGVDDDPVDLGGGRGLRYWRDGTVEAVWSTRKPAYEMTLSDGTQLTAGVGHRFLVRSGSNWEWRKIESIHRTVEQRGGELFAARPYETPTDNWVDAASIEYKAGYLTGANLGDGWYRLAEKPRQSSYWTICQSIDDGELIDRVLEYAAEFGVSLRTREIEPDGKGWQKKPMVRMQTGRQAEVAGLIALRDWPKSDSFRAGWLAGMYDTDGSLHKRGYAIVTQKDPAVLAQFQQFAKDLGYDSAIVDPPQGRSAGTVRIAGPVTKQAEFLTLIQPALSRKVERLVGRSMRDFSNTQIESVREIGETDLMDITTSTGTFIAAGVVSHNCYGHAAWESGLFGDMDYEDIQVGNVWIDRAGIEAGLHLKLEPLSTEVLEAAGRWLDEVVYAWQHDQEAQKEPAREVCATTCGYFRVCREWQSDVTGLLEDPVVLEAVDMYAEGHELERTGKRLKEEAKAELRGISGSTGAYTLRWVHVNAQDVGPSTRRAHDKIDLKPIKKGKS